MTKQKRIKAFAGYYIEETGWTADDVENCMIVRGASEASGIQEHVLAQAVRDYAETKKAG